MLLGGNIEEATRAVGHLIPHKFYLVCGKVTNLSVDHVVPRSLGGAKYAPENIIFLCKDCNSIKSDQMPDTWIQKINSENIENFCPHRFFMLQQAVDIAMSLFNFSKSAELTTATI